MRKSTFELFVSHGLWALMAIAIGACHDDGEPDRPHVSRPVFPVISDEAGAAQPDASASLEAGAPASGPADAGAAPDQLPCDVASFLRARCTSCHGATPLPGIPMALASYADLAKRSPTFADQTYAQRAAQRVQMGNMPPGGGLSPAEVQLFVGWVEAGAQPSACATALDASVPSGAGPDASVASDAQAAEAGPNMAGGGDAAPSPGDGGQADAAASACTSGKSWSLGDAGSPLMTPGEACLGCHTPTAATYLSFAGTLFSAAHDPDRCYGALVNGASILLKGADGRKLSLTPNSAGNFFTQSAVAKPYIVEVHYQGRVLVKQQPQTSGDCNACHSEAGESGAAGRILLP